MSNVLATMVAASTTVEVCSCNSKVGVFFCNSILQKIKYIFTLTFQKPLFCNIYLPFYLREFQFYL